MEEVRVPKTLKRLSMRKATAKSRFTLQQRNGSLRQPYKEMQQNNAD
jgi:hypothetical protein